MTDNRVALLGLIIEEGAQTDKVNELLSEYGKYIVGRMGIPHCTGNISLISIAMEAPQDVISTLSGKIGQLKGVSSKVITSKTSL